MAKAQVSLLANLKAGGLAPGCIEDIEKSLKKKKLSYNLFDVELLTKKDVELLAPILAAIGGDGTVSLAAHLALKHKRTLAVIPAGTFNHFAKDLSLPLSPTMAVERIAQGRTKLIDTATVNGRLFLNNSSIGFYPKAVAIKNQLRHRIGHALALVTSVAYVLTRLKTYKLQLKIEGHTETIQTKLLVIANNRYNLRQFGLASRQKLQAGWLYIYNVQPKSKEALGKTSLKLLIGEVSNNDIQTLKAKKLEILISAHRKMQVAIDGEAHRLETPLTYQIQPKSLRVIV